MISLRCSSLPLLRACAASAGSDGIKVDSSSPEARLGTAFHAGIARLIQGSPLDLPTLAATLAHLHEVDCDELEKLLGIGWAQWQVLKEHFPNPLCEQELVHDDLVGLTGHADVLAIVEAD